jgi:hypothetical protein
MLETMNLPSAREMTIEDWLAHAVRDAERRGLPELRPLLEGLACATAALRRADWNADAAASGEPAASRDAR